MKLKMYSIRDQQLASYDRPMFMVTHGQAIRAFTDECNRAEKDNQLYQHADDYSLHYLGEWETDTAKFEPTDEPEQLALGKNVKR